MDSQAMSAGRQVDEVKARVDILPVVSEYVQLKKAGKNYKGLCPFHGEKSPSFMVSPERGIFKCFGCSKGGDVFTFMQEINGIDFPEALKILAARAGVTLRQVELTPEQKEKDTLIQINGLASDFYHYLLAKHPVAREAREYLKSRQVTDDTAALFKLGFAPRQRDVLTQFLMKKGFKPPILIRAGVTLPDGRGFRDRFYQRLLFPIRNLQGEVVGFSGRILGEGEPKYLNSPDSNIFNKSKLLFGLDIAKTHVKKEKEIILVEGNFDVILSYQAGVQNVAAPLGTALGESQLELIKRFTDTLSFCFDTDNAGRLATQRGIALAENQGLSVNVITVPGDKDPSDLINHDPKKWPEIIKTKKPILDFYLDSFSQQFGTETAESKRKVGASFLPMLGKIEDPLLRNHYLQKMAALLKLEETVLAQALQRFRPQDRSVTKAARVEIEALKPASLEKYLLAMIVQSKQVPKELTAIDFQDEVYRGVKTGLLSLPSTASHFEIEALLALLTDPEKKLVEELLLFDIGELDSEEQAHSEVSRCIKRIKEVNLRLNLRKLALSVKQAEAQNDDQKVASLNKEFRDLSLQLATITQGGN